MSLESEIIQLRETIQACADRQFEQNERLIALRQKLVEDYDPNAPAPEAAAASEEKAPKPRTAVRKVAEKPKEEPAPEPEPQAEVQEEEQETELPPGLEEQPEEEDPDIKELTPKDVRLAYPEMQKRVGVPKAREAFNTIMNRFGKKSADDFSPKECGIAVAYMQSVTKD